MSTNSRHDQIINLLQKLRTLTVNELTERLGVSTVTIRKDLTFLEEQGLIVRSHGGAKLAQDVANVTNLVKRGQAQTEVKERLAAKALEFVQDGDTIYLDSGSSVGALAAGLRNRAIRVITNSLQVMNTLADAPDLSLIAVGGNYRLEAGSFIGPAANDTVSRFQVDLAFLGATAFSDKGMFFSQNVIESQLKEAVLLHASRRIIVADSTKFKAQAFSLFARPTLVDILITDADFPDTAIEAFGELGIEVVVG